jgi:hypothetical protein
MTYNLTSIMAGNETGMLTFTQGVNDVLLGGWLGTLFLIGLAFILFISFMLTTQSVKKSIGATSFICFSLSLTLTGLGLLPPLGIFLTLIISALTIATTWGSD